MARATFNGRSGGAVYTLRGPGRGRKPVRVVGSDTLKPYRGILPNRTGL